jgi:hypothetical protein
MRRNSKIGAALACIMFAAMNTLSARAETVDVLLVLAADVSRSVGEREFKLQRDGYAAALNDPRVIQAISGGLNGAVAITFIEWSGASQQKVVVDWIVVRDEEGAADVAAAMQSAPRPFSGLTSISAAIDFSLERLRAAPVEADKHIIDISGDGTNNAGRPITEARDEAIAAGVTINALAIINESQGFGHHTQPPGGLPKYFEENVIGGFGAFMLEAKGFDKFAEAITRKLVTEIAGEHPPMQTASVNAAMLP